MNKRLVFCFACIALIAGCGSKQPSSPAGVNPAEGAAKEKSAGKSEKGAKEGSDANKTSSPSNSKTAPEKKLTRRQIQEKLDKIPLPKLYQFARTAALQVLKSMGFPNASVLLTDRGHTILVTIPRDFACEVDLATVPKVAAAIKRIVIFASKVKLGVADNGGSLKRYVKERCKPLEMPAPENANAPVALSEKGTGFRGFPEFEIKSNRWTLSWENQGGALEIYITQGQKLVDYIKTDQRGVGKKILDGPGTFRVTVTGSGNWAVRVYDGI